MVFYLLTAFIVGGVVLCGVCVSIFGDAGIVVFLVLMVVFSVLLTKFQHFVGDEH